MREPCEQDGGAFRIVLGKRRERLEYGDLRAEAMECLRQLEPDRTGPDHNEMLRTFGEIKYGLIGEVRRLGEPRDRRHRWRGAARDHEAPRFDLDITHLDGMAVLEAGGAVDHVHAQSGETLFGIVRRDRGNHLVNMIMD